MLEVVLSIAVPLCLVVMVLGCLNCFLKKKQGFSNFMPQDSGQAQHNPAFSVDISDAQQPSDQVIIEPLPDIMSKSSAAPVLRPKITCMERGKQEATLSLISVQKSFPRDHLMYLNEIGSGWFGQVIESEAMNITSSSAKSQVVVKMMKDDASKNEQKLFLNEVSAFRCLDHANLMSLLGQCTEASPYLIILEHAAHGNLKTYLQQHRHELENLIKKQMLLNFALDAGSGLACLHRHDYIHNDVSARNCLVMSDFTVKIGDYGVSDFLFKEDYFNTGTELLPIRWMAPETLMQQDGVWTAHVTDKSSDMWSFGILLWEICSLGERPYDLLTDKAVLQGVVVDRVVLPSPVDKPLPFKDGMWPIMGKCWKDASQRMSIEQVCYELSLLIQPTKESLAVTPDFDQKWEDFGNSKIRTDSDLDSRTGLAGSFATDSSSPRSDKMADADMQFTGADDSKLYYEDELRDSKSSTPLSLPNGKNASLKNSSDTVTPDLSLVHDQMTIEDETENSHNQGEEILTSVKSTIQQPVTTSTPNLKNQNSTSQFLSPVSPDSSAYVTATQDLAASEDEEKPKNSLGKDFSLDSEGLSFHELMDHTVQGNGQGNINSNNTPGGPASISANDEDFSEFVRTSPTAPRADFTDFEKAENVSETNSGDETISKEAQNQVLSENETSDHNDFSDFASADKKIEAKENTTDISNENTKNNGHSDYVTSTATNPLPGSPDESVSSNSHDAMSKSLEDNMPSSTDSGLLASDFSLPDSGPFSETLHADSLGSPTIPDWETSTQVTHGIEQYDERSNEIEVADASTLPKQLNTAVSNETSSSSIGVIEPDDSFQPGTRDATATSLTSDPNLVSDDLFSLGAAPGAPPTHTTRDRGFSDKPEESGDFLGLEPLPQPIQSVSDVLKENKEDLLNAFGNTSADFSSIEFLDPKPSSDQMETGDPDSSKEQEAGPEKVGTPSKYESLSKESGINSHSVTTESPTSLDSNFNSALDSDSISPVQYSNDNSDSSDDESNCDIHKENCPKPDEPSLSPRSSLYRASNICLTHAVEVDVSSAADDSLDIDLEDSPANFTSPADSDTEISSTTSSSTSGSGREYVCVGPYDTGQPPPSLTETSKANLSNTEAVDTDKDEDLDEQTLQTVTEIYLSRGVKSPRFFEIPPLETIPEHQPMPSVQEDSNHTHSDTSSMDVRYDDMFCSDGFEWDDFCGDPLVGREMTSNQNIQQSSSLKDLDISDWSLDIESGNALSDFSIQTGETDSPNNSVQSERAVPTQVDFSFDSLKRVQCLSDSELTVTASKKPKSSPKQTLVSSLLSHHGVLPSTTSTSVVSSKKTHFYSLTNDLEIDTDSSSEGVTSPLPNRTSKFESPPPSSSSSSSSAIAISSPPPFSSPSHQPEVSVLHHDLDPSMGSGLSCANKDSALEIQSEQISSPSHTSDLLGLGEELTVLNQSAESSTQAKQPDDGSQDNLQKEKGETERLDSPNVVEGSLLDL